MRLASFTHNYILIFGHKIECNIDKWATGTRVDIHFTEEAYKPVFEEHLQVFNEFADYCREHGCPELVQRLLERIYDHGWFVSCLTSSTLTHLHFSISAGAEPFQKEVTRQMAPNAFAAAIAEFNNHNGRFEDE